MQQGGNKFKRLFRQAEINTLLKGCHSGLKQALQAFQVSTSLFINIGGRIEVQSDQHWGNSLFQHSGNEAQVTEYAQRNPGTDLDSV
jgi:hypothetical protein